MTPRGFLVLLACVFLVALLFAGCAQRLVVMGPCTIAKNTDTLAVQCQPGGRVMVE